jgi:hypothetical protein
VCKSAGCAVESATHQPPTAAAAPLNGQQTMMALHNTSYSQQQQQQQYSQQQQQQQQYNPQQQQQQQSDLATSLMAALKPILLHEEIQVQLLGCQLLVAVAARAPAALLQQLMQLDCCEHLFEVLRGTLGSCSTRPNLAAAALDRRHAHRVPGSSGAGMAAAAAAAGAVAAAGAFEAAAEGLQAAAVAALRCLASQGELLWQEIVEVTFALSRYGW